MVGDTRPYFENDTREHERERDDVGFSLTRGGPFHDVSRAVGLVRYDAFDLARLVLLLVAITWLPVVLLHTAERFLAGEPRTRLLLQPDLHVRTLIAVPLLLIAEEALHRMCRRAIDAFREGEFIRPATGDPLGAAIRRAVRWRDSVTAEVCMVLAMLGLQITMWVVFHRAGVGDPETSTLSPAHAWYAFVTLPLCNFLTLRLLFRWFIWARLLWNLSRHELRLTPTHPDLSGGLEPLAQPTFAFAGVLAALACVMSSIWAKRIFNDGVDVTSFSDEFAALVLLGFLLAFGPLLCFSPQLVDVRLRGLRTYGDLGLRYTRLFHQRWIERRDDAALLGTADLQSLADLANSFDVIRRMRPLPFGPRYPLLVLAVIAVPILPLILTKVPIHTLLASVGRALLGGIPE